MLMTVFKTLTRGHSRFLARYPTTIAVLGAAVFCIFTPFVGEQEIPCERTAQWRQLIHAHVARYPDMGVADLYKLLHQATMGAEHAVASSEAADEWLARELRNLPEGPREPLVDTLGTGGRFARIHLRPFQALGHPRTNLSEAFVKTASGSHGDRSELECALATARTLSHEGRLPWTGSEVAGFFATQESKGFPAVHHSSQFERTYRPAYRVIAVELISHAVGSSRR